MLATPVIRMRVIGVVDLAAGRAVHARAGQRAQYRPVESPLISEAGDAIALARAYHEQFGIDEIYTADLDALTGQPPQWKLLERLSAAIPRLVVDAGVYSVESARRALEHGASCVIVALETLPSFDVLAAIVAAVGGERVVFSLDLRDGVPIVLAGSAHAEEPPLDLVALAAHSGVGGVVVLDLARVGTGAGIDETLVVAVRRNHPSLDLLAGGGVRNRADLARLAASGCDGVLVATALLEGRLRREDLDALRARRAP
jgi:phosphoribosylformimino-5-aminoimidazole carboxamide ribotide isomerase